MFVVNFFLSFFLLQITARVCKRKPKAIRLILSSFFGGAYSLIILVDKLPFFITFLSKMISAMIMLLIAFSFYRLTSFFKTFLVFMFSSFVLLGIVVGLYFITGSNSIAINNSTVYFDISARALLLSAFLAYIISCIIVRLHNKSLSKDEIYNIEIFNDGKSIKACALVDTGNKLVEPFSNSPVVIVKKDKAESIVGSSQIRYIPATTVSGETLLNAFKPDKIIIKSAGVSEVVENVYVALSDDIDSSTFSAVINPEIISI